MKKHTIVTLAAITLMCIFGVTSLALTGDNCEQICSSFNNSSVYESVYDAIKEGCKTTGLGFRGYKDRNNNEWYSCDSMYPNALEIRRWLYQDCKSRCSD